MTSDETITEIFDAPDPADTLSGTLPAVREIQVTYPVYPDGDEWDAETLRLLHDDNLPVLADLRVQHYTTQVVAALHGNPQVFDLDAATQDEIAKVSRVFEHIARGILGSHDPVTVARRAAVLLMADHMAGTPMRCACMGCTRETTVTDGPGWKLSRAHAERCDRIHQPLGQPVDWDVAGRDDIMCPPCWAAQPKHAAAKTAPVKAKTATTRRRRPSQARGKAANGSSPGVA